MLREIVVSMRPRRWVKNLAFFAALLFARRAGDLPVVFTSLAGFGLLCLASGGMYLINDLLDLAEDRRHPDKRLRAMAAGRLSTRAGGTAAAVLVLGALAGSFALDGRFGACLGVYVGLGAAYSLGLKRVPIVDLFCQSFLLLLRIVAGAVLIHVPLSNWLLLCSLLLSLFLALSRRRFEITSEKAPDAVHIANYSAYAIDQMIAVVTSATLVAYALYTFSPETAEKVGGRNLVFTVPFVLYGIFRYLYLIYQKDSNYAPDREVFFDRPFLLNMALYLVVAAAILYSG